MTEAEKTEIENCAGVLRAGGVILYPTDTLWGLGCDATNEEAVQKIFTLKKRSESKSMIVLLDSENRLDSYVREIPEQAYTLMEYSEKPLTIIYDGARNLANSVVAADGSIAIRIVKETFCRRLIERFRKPVVSTSANLSGQPPPATFADIDAEIRMGVDYVVNLRQQDKSNQASTIIRLRINGTIEIIRK
jgi:L-threonylcarbamoyladenylate synthase